MKLTIISLFAPLLFCKTMMAQYITPYPDIPRVDVHTHMGENDTAIANYLKLHDELVEESQVDMAIWVNLGNSRNSLVDIELVNKLSEGRMVCGIADYRAHDGLAYDPEQLTQFQQQGYVGYKIWSGPWYRGLDKMEDGYPYIDDSAHTPTFSKMEEIGFPGASVHIADPNGPWNQRSPWLADPVEYWKEINAWHKVLERHPDLVVVAAHGNWLLCQDAQIDYLRYMFTQFPNLHIDLAATYQYFNLVSHGNLRSFIIEWADRILYATDIGTWKDPEETERRKQQYLNTFEILETDHLVKGSFFSKQPIQGLNLPEDVLEKIYYKNAARVYPKVRDQLEKLGYKE
ncbi:MAG: amidohydrolase family protein [Cyclobacteriaceae bacterium]